MHDEGPHPLLAQVPLTVSPFVSLPTATTLPYTYKALPSTLPPSIVETNSSSRDNGKPKFITSSSGHAAHPDDIASSCTALQSHLEQVHKYAVQDISIWQDDIRERELAEKRRIAPGWLDRQEKILQPERTTSESPLPDNYTERASRSTAEAPQQPTDIQELGESQHTRKDGAGEELDRMFGNVKF
ncbi:MAG: hypothetical protein M1831_002380 [Alyxoria varia]|nr:MAG: hypothetical protein M1831_002380 [Alyxoria varia]